MLHKKIRFSIVASIMLGLSLAISGCNPDSPFSITPLKTGEMNATISGFGFFSATNSQATNSSPFDVLASVKNNSNIDSIVIRLTVTKNSTTPYTIDVATDASSEISYCIFQSNSCITYVAKKSTAGSSGQIKITSTSPNLEGTFSGTLKQVGGAGTVTISGGEFNAGF